MLKLSNKEDKFFTLFKQSTEIVCRSVEKLEQLMMKDFVTEADGEDMHAIEREADVMTAQIIDRLNSTFITPLDREDIYTLAQVLDDIVDYAEGTVERMLLYRTAKPSVGTLEMVRLVGLATEQIRMAFCCLNNIKFKKNELLAAAEEIYHIESAGDKLYRLELARLFEHEKDAIEIIKWKEILENVETALDHCEAIADLLKGVVLKYE